MMLLVPLLIYTVLFFYKLCRNDSTDGTTVLKLTDLLERYMFPQNKVMLSTRIAKGAFGTIYKGYAHKLLQHENETLVAIKEVKGTGKENDSHLESQKVGKISFNFGFKNGLLITCFATLLVAVVGSRVKGFDAVRRTREFGQFAWNRC